MLRERVAPQFEVIRVIVLEDSPCCEVPHHHQRVDRLLEPPDNQLRPQRRPRLKPGGDTRVLLARFKRDAMPDMPSLWSPT